MKRQTAFVLVFGLFIVGLAILLFRLNGPVLHQQNEGYRYVIGVSQANLIEPLRIAMNEDIKREARKYQDVQVVFRDAGGDSDKQINDIGELYKSGINLLIVSMDDSQKLTAEVSRVYHSIPVIVLDRAVEGGDYTLFIGVDNLSIGRQAGRLVEKIYHHKKCNIVEIQGTLNSEISLERSRGFHRIIRKYKNLNPEGTLICNWKLDDTVEDVTNLLYKPGNKKNAVFAQTNVIFAHSDYMALGAYQAAQALHSKPTIIGVDGLPGKNGGLSLVKTGRLYATIRSSTGGAEAVDYAVRILKGQKKPPKRVILKSRMITRNNVDRFLKEASSSG